MKTMMSWSRFACIATVSLILSSGCGARQSESHPPEPVVEWSQDDFLERVDICGLTAEWVRSEGGTKFSSTPEMGSRLTEVARCLGVPAGDFSAEFEGVAFAMVWLYGEIDLTSTIGELPVDLGEVYRFVRRTMRRSNGVLWATSARLLAEFDRLEDLLYVGSRATHAASDEEFAHALMALRNFCRIEARSLYSEFERSDVPSRARMAREFAEKIPWQENATCFRRAEVVEAWLGRGPEIEDFVVPR